MNFFPVKPALLWFLFLWEASPPQVSPASHFRYQRNVNLLPNSTATQACAVLDADVFSHSAASLKDLRLYAGQSEIPYATTLSEPFQQESEDARILRLRSKAGHILFDLEMPHRPYTGLTLDFAARDYIAEVAVSGGSTPTAANTTALGTFTLFDLTSQGLSHNTVVPLLESTFPYLHLDLVLTPAPGSTSPESPLSSPGLIKAATVPPSREAQSLYTVTQRTNTLQQGHEGVATFNVGMRVPIERIAFTLPPGYKGNFSRIVIIEAHAVAPDLAASTDSAADRSSPAIAPFSIENVTGSILRVHKVEASRELSAESLGIPVSIGSNMQKPAILEVKVEDGEVKVEDGVDPPLPLTVELQMRQRKLCFDTRTATAPLVLFYGDPSLDAPAYTEAALRQAASNPRFAELGAETQNSSSVGLPAPRRAARHHAILRWIALLGCVCIFALLVIRRSHRARR